MAKQPMNKFLKFVLWTGGIVVGGFILLLAAAAIIVPIVLPPAKLKAMAEEKLTGALKHKVTVGDVRFNVLSGFNIKNLVIANRQGWADKPMVSAKDISISYHLFPLLWGKVSLGEVKLVRPDILVEHRNPNQFNFSDMTGNNPRAASAPTPQAASKKATKSKTKSKKNSKGKKKHKKSALLPVPGDQAVAFGSFFADTAWADTTPSTGKPSKPLDVSIDSINVSHANLEYLDEAPSPAQKATADDFNLTVKNVSLDGGKITYAIASPFTYQKKTYQFVLNGSVRYFLSSQSIKDLVLKGTLNDQGFNITGEAADMANNFTPTMDGEASLNMLKFVGLVPALSQMPQGSSLGGSAIVDFHLAGSMSNGLELSGTADGSGLTIQYKDLFFKTTKTACKVDFKSVLKFREGIYDFPSFKVAYADWTVTGSLDYAGSTWSCKVHSDSLPFKGLPGMLPKLKNCTVDGGGSLDLAVSSSAGKSVPFLVNGRVAFKSVGVSLPNEPYLQSMNGTLYCANNVARLPTMGFKAFDGTGAMGVTYNVNTGSIAYSFSLKNVDAQKAVDGSIDAYVTTKDLSKFKDMLFGTMNFAYAGSGKIASGDQMMASQVGSGGYSLVNAKIKGTVIKKINGYVKDSSDEMGFEKIDGVLGMKNKVFSYTANTEGKVGAIREKGGIDVVKMAYSPDMTIQADIKREFIDSDMLKSALPGEIGALVKDPAFLEDDNGNVPVDLKFTGPVSDNNYSWDSGRLINNVKKHAGEALQKAAQPAVQDLGNKIKGLFGQ